MKAILISTFAMATLLFSCKKDDKVHLQPHDQNHMMALFHDMLSDMEMMEMTMDPEIDFPAMMILHHMGAIDMAHLELEQGKNDSLKRTAQKVIDAQQMEIHEFQAYLDSANDKIDEVPAFTMEQMTHMKKMHELADIQFITGDIDNDFATLLIIHHQGALEDSEAYLMYGTDPYLLKKAKHMIEMQTMEITELRNWLMTHKR
jgi:uncharacterized protein (DUF305 family)